jgi:hypothetical protein
MRRILITLTFAASLSGCVTSLVPMNETTAVPKERIFATDLTTPVDGRQKITIVRNSGVLFAMGTSVDLLVDGERTAALRTGEAVTIYVTPGDHLLTTKLAGITASVPLVTPSRFRIYRIDMNDDDMKLQPSFE